MRKLFNYALLAAALLVGVNVNAETIEVSDPANLQAAFDNEATDITIKITSPGVQFNQTASIVLNADKKWTLDLNGHDLVFDVDVATMANTMQAASMFQLYKGILRVKNGNVINPIPVAAGKFYPEGKTSATLRCFFVCGEAEKTHSTEMSAYKTQLYVEEGVFVDCTYGKDAVEVYDYCGGEATNKHAAFGVYIELEGKMHGEKYGIQMSGQVSAVPAEGENPAEYNYPKYVVKKNAEVYANPTLTGDGGAGIYLGGFCFANIHGYVHGSSGVYVKNGIVDIVDAVIASDYTGTYVPGGHDGSSTQGAGSAIVIESNNVSYGNTVVTVGGDTKVTSQVGFAIEQKVQGENSDKIEGIHIEGGTFEGGTEGGVIFDNNTVTGGKVNIEDGNFTNGDVTTYLPEGTTATTVDDGNGNKTIVVSTSPDEDKAENQDIANQDYLEWNTEKTQTISSGKVTVGYFDMKKGTVTIEKGATLEITDKLIMNGAARIVVEPGATLISSGEKGIVAPSVENITIQTNELAEEGAGQFLFNPAVNSNKNTNATLQIIANSFTKHDQDGTTTDYLNQRFGIPTHNAVKKITAKKDGEDIPVYFTKYVGDGFLTLGYINVPGRSLNYSLMNDPFGYYQLQCNTEDIGTIVSLSGEMVSNANQTIKVAKGWNTFANSYSGNLDIAPVLTALMEVPGMCADIYVPLTNDGSWKGFTTKNMATILVDGTYQLAPMTAFLFKNENDVAAQVVMNYKDMVWDPIMEPETEAKAPRHNDFEAMAKISVMQNNQNIDAVYMIQDASFTADIENGYDGEKYLNEKVNFYVNGADMKQQTLATNVLEGTYLGFAAKEAGVYTLSFEKMAGNALVLVDLVNGQEIDMLEGAQYSFKVDANYSNDNRFMVKNAAQAPTAMDKVDAKANAVKVISDGQFRIVKNGRAYNAIGAEL